MRISLSSGIELVDLADQVLFVHKNSSAQHLSLMRYNAGQQITEGVAGVLAQRRVIVGAHQASTGDGMAQLAHIADHLVVLLHRQVAFPCCCTRVNHQMRQLLELILQTKGLALG